MAAIFGKRKFFLKIAKCTFLRYPMDRKFHQNNSYYAQLRQICVFPFWAKIRKFKMAAICGEGKIFLKIAKSTFLKIPHGSKISTKSLYLARLRRYKQICVLPFWAKIQNGRHMWEEENS